MYLKRFTVTSGSPAATAVTNARAQARYKNAERIWGRKDMPPHEPRDEAAMAAMMAAAGKVVGREASGAIGPLAVASGGRTLGNLVAVACDGALGCTECDGRWVYSVVTARDVDGKSRGERYWNE